MASIGVENESVEFKEGIGQLDKGMKSLAAMLNRHHHGTVYFGIDDNGEVIGIDVGESTLDKIRNAVRSDILPQVIPEIEVLESDDGKKYVSVSVSGHSVPYSCKDKYYIRDVSSDEIADPNTLIQIVLSRGADSLKDMQSDVQDLTFEMLSTMMVFKNLHPRNDEGYYRSMGFLDDHGKFNMTAYLLSDQNEIPIQIVEFKGKDRSEIVKRDDYGGCCLIKSMEEVISHLAIIMETKVDTDSLTRKEVPLFDMGAFREAWVNACVHNAWRSHTPPSVLLFDDRIEVVSYGRIPFPLSEDDFFSGDSRPINHGLFNVFSKLNKIEQSGHGVPRIVMSYGKEAFTLTESGVKVTIKFAFEPRSVTVRRFNNSKRDELNAENIALLDYLGCNEHAKLSEAAEATGMSLSLVKKKVSILKSKGLLKNEGTNRNSVWRVL